LKKLLEHDTGSGYLSHSFERWCISKILIFKHNLQVSQRAKSSDLVRTGDAKKLIPFLKAK